MPIEIWKTNSGKWFWTCRASNGEVISDSAEIYSSRAKALNGVAATAKEFAQWQKEQKPKKPAKAISAPRKRAAKRSMSSSSRTRKAGQAAG